eukprot:467000_1
MSVPLTKKTQHILETQSTNPRIQNIYTPRYTKLLLLPGGNYIEAHFTGAADVKIKRVNKDRKYTMQLINTLINSLNNDTEEHLNHVTKECAFRIEKISYLKLLKNRLLDKINDIDEVINKINHKNNNCNNEKDFMDLSGYDFMYFKHLLKAINTSQMIKIESNNETVNHRVEHHINKNINESIHATANGTKYMNIKVENDTPHHMNTNRRDKSISRSKNKSRNSDNRSRSRSRNRNRDNSYRARRLMNRSGDNSGANLCQIHITSFDEFLHNKQYY